MYTPFFYRTQDGAEIDLGCHVLQPDEAFVVHSGSEQWPMADDVTAIPVRDLAKRFLERR